MLAPVAQNSLVEYAARADDEEQCGPSWNRCSLCNLSMDIIMWLSISSWDRLWTKTRKKTIKIIKSGGVEFEI